jgi:hypothetical protein
MIASRYHWLAQTPDHATWRGLRYASRLAADGSAGGLATQPAT